MYDIAVENAVNRALLLNESSIDKTIILDNVDKVCSVNEIIDERPDNYGLCYVVSGAPEKWCGYILYDPGCRTLSVNQEIWENETIQKRIIEAALQPCKYLFDPEGKDSQEIIENSRFPIQERQDIEQYWHHAGCDIWSVNVVFIGLYENIRVFPPQKHRLLKVYKIYRKNEKIGGSYVKL